MLRPPSFASFEPLAAVFKNQGSSYELILEYAYGGYTCRLNETRCVSDANGKKKIVQQIYDQ
jgi:hypothetical protein